MSELVVWILISCFVLLANADTGFCVWGRTASDTTYINGLYDYYENNGVPYYEKTDDNCPDNNLYLYQAFDRWIIGPNFPSPTSYIARCTEPTDNTGDPPTECEDWEMQNKEDAGITIYEEECPNFNICDGIKADYVTNAKLNECRGNFVRYSKGDDDNQAYNDVFYKREYSGFTYLFFNPNDFRWICSNSTIDIEIGGQCRESFNDSTTIIDYQKTPQWQKFGSPYTRNDYDWTFSRNKTLLLQCTSSQPTVSPTPGPTINYSMTTDLLQVFRTEIKQSFDGSGTDKPLLAASVRLVFNDCIGPKEYNYNDDTSIYDDTPTFMYNTICDGCINEYRDEFHDGLYETAIEPLTDIFDGSSNDWNEKMTLADFWAAVGTVAIEYAIELGGFMYGGDNDDTSTLYQLPMYFGRRDCTESPYIAINNTEAKDLEGILSYTYQELIDFFEDNLNFTVSDTVAMMASHVLAEKNDAYDTFFDAEFDTPYVLDNSYFIHLLNNDWESVYESGDSHWETEDGDTMLNADITMGYDIDDLWSSTTNTYQCSVITSSGYSSYLPACSVRDDTEDIIETYANNNQQFLEDFGTVWKKLVTIGYDDDLIENEFEATSTPDTTEADIAYRPGILYHTIVSILIVVTTICCAIHDDY